jgi:hypothetical protein
VRSVKILIIFLFMVGPTCAGREPSPETRRIQNVLRRARHMGAHGLGYGSRSLDELSKGIHPADIPVLIRLVSDRNYSVGAQFALASQCGDAIEPTLQALRGRVIDRFAAADILSLIVGFSRCTAADQARAAGLINRIEGMTGPGMALPE